MNLYDLGLRNEGVHMKQRKRFSIAIAVMAILLSTLSGCSKQDHGLNSDNPIKITMWHYYSSSQKNAFDQLVAEFNTTLGKEKGIIVEAVPQGGINELEKSLKASAEKEIGADKMPDLFTAYASNAKYIDETYGLVDMNTYLTKKERDEYIQGYLNEGYIHQDDRLLLFPTAKATELLFINKSTWNSFESATGVDVNLLKTWEGLVEVAKKYYEYSNGKAFFGRDAMANYILAGTAQLETPLFTIENNEVAIQLNKDTMRTLWDNYYVPYVQGYFLGNGKYASDDLKTNDIVAYVGSTSSSAFFPSTVSYQENDSKQIDYMILPVPNFKGYDPIAVQQGAGVAISKCDETHEYASVVFLRWFTETQRNLEYAAETGYLPVKKEATYEMLEEEKRQDIKPIVQDTLKIAMDQIQNSTLYTFDAFTKSGEVRNFIEGSLKQQAKQDRATINEMIANGEDTQNVLSTYLNDSTFETWFDTFSSGLKEVLR